MVPAPSTIILLIAIVVFLQFSIYKNFFKNEVKDSARPEASQSSGAHRRRNQMKSVFSGDLCPGKNTSEKIKRS